MGRGRTQEIHEDLNRVFRKRGMIPEERVHYVIQYLTSLGMFLEDKEEGHLKLISWEVTRQLVYAKSALSDDPTTNKED